MVTSGPLQGVSFRLKPGRRVIGREDGVDILLEDLKVSRRHASVEMVDGRVRVTDLGSTYGTSINDRQVTGSEELHDGDRLRMGHVQLRFFDPSSATTEPLDTRVFIPAQPPYRERARTSAALAGPTQAVVPTGGRRVTRVVLTVCGCALMAVGAAVAHQIL